MSQQISVDIYRAMVAEDVPKQHVADMVRKHIAALKELQVEGKEDTLRALEEVLLTLE